MTAAYLEKNVNCFTLLRSS